MKHETSNRNELEVPLLQKKDFDLPSLKPENSSPKKVLQCEEETQNLSKDILILEMGYHVQNSCYCHDILVCNQTNKLITKKSFDTANLNFRNSLLLELFCIAGESAKWYSCFRKVWQFLIKLNIHMPYNPTIPILVFTLEK